MWCFRSSFQFVINGIARNRARNGSNNSSTVYAISLLMAGLNRQAIYKALTWQLLQIDSFGYALGRMAPEVYNQFYKYTPSTNSWAAIAPSQASPAQETTYFVLDGIMLVEVFAKLEACLWHWQITMYYDPVTNTWSPHHPVFLVRPANMPLVSLLMTMPMRAVWWI